MRRTFLLLMICASFVRAGEPDWTKVHVQTIRGIDQLYNLEFDEASATFEGVIRMAPQDPRGYFFRATVDYWIFMFSKDPNAFARFFALSDTVIQLCESALEQNPDNWNAKFYLGGAYGFRGLMHQRNSSFLKAVWDGKKGYNRLEECVQKKPDLVDAQMGFGLFTYLVGKIPRSFRWVVNLIGFSGDTEAGLTYLRAAAEKGVYTRSEATFFLSQFLYAEGKTDEAFQYLNRLLKKYPDNTLFLLSYGSWQSRLNNIDSALVAARRAIEINTRKKIRYGDEIAYDVLQQCYWLKNDFASTHAAIESCIIKTENKENLRNSLYYRLGLCHDILGERADALKAYKLVREAKDKDRGGEIYTYKKAQERIASPLRPIDLLLIKASNARGTKNFDTAMKLYREAAGIAPADLDLQTSALYGMQQTLNDREQYDEAMALHRRLVPMRPPTETWIIPHSYFLAGQMLAKQGKKEEAKAAFKKVSEFDSYDFQRSLEDRVEGELKKLGD